MLSAINLIIGNKIHVFHFVVKIRGIYATFFVILINKVYKNCMQAILSVLGIIKDMVYLFFMEEVFIC